MIIVEISKYNNATELINHSPFTYKTLCGRRSTASYWTDIFGATGESGVETVITSVIENPSTKYTKVPNLSACESLSQSFYWDNANQVLYMHIPQSTKPDKDLFSFGQIRGYSDKDVVYLDNQEYLPLVKGVPSIAQRADIVNYNMMAFISGNVKLDNTGGHFDDVIDSPIYGNDVDIFYLNGGESRVNLVPLASLYIEDFLFSLGEFTIKVQDKRKSQNNRVLSERTTQGDLVPLVYGQVRACKALVADAEGATGSVNYRAGITFSSLGTVQVWKDDKWNTVTPTATSALGGTFTLSATDGRSDGTSTGSPLQARLLEPTGITVAKITDIIKDLNTRVLGIPYNNSFYDVEEWELESSTLTTAGVVFDKDIELYEAIRILQGGGNRGFRYEIRADGYRTVRLDDWERLPTKIVDWTYDTGEQMTDEYGNILQFKIERPSVTRLDIKNSLSMPVSTDTSNFYASVTVAYDKDFNGGKYFRVTDSSKETEAFNKYRQKPSIEIETLLTNSTDASSRALWSAERFSDIRGIVDIVLHGQEYYNVRIYDTLYIDFSVETRQYYGKWKAQIIGINPEFDGLSNRVMAVLTEKL